MTDITVACFQPECKIFSKFWFFLGIHTEIICIYDKNEGKKYQTCKNLLPEQQDLIIYATYRLNFCLQDLLTLLNL